MPISSDPWAPWIIGGIVLIIFIIIYFVWASNRRTQTWKEDVQGRGSGNPHGHVHPPGVSPEDVQLAGRRVVAAIMMVIGTIFIIGSFAVGLRIACSSGDAKGGLTWGLIVFGVGLFLAIYGNYLWNKYKHIAWTKEALREFDQARIHANMERPYGSEELMRMRRSAGGSGPTVEQQQQPPPPPPPPPPAGIARLVLPDNSIISLPRDGARPIGRADFMAYLGTDRSQYVSREHLWISSEHSRYYIEDRSSKGGTLHNGVNIRGTGRRELQDGDTITLAGQVNMVFRTT